MEKIKENLRLPIIDLSNYFGVKATEDSKKDVLEKWFNAFSTIGFAILNNSGVNKSSIKALDVSARSFLRTLHRIKVGLNALFFIDSHGFSLNFVPSYPLQFCADKNAARMAIWRKLEELRNFLRFYGNL